MRKLLLCIFVILCLTGCQKKEREDVSDAQYKEYKEYVAKLDKRDSYEDSTEFSVKIIKNKTNKDNYRYDIIIDNPQIEMHNIKAIARIKVEEGYSYPSIGVLEEGAFSLVPNVVDKKKNIYKGINLSAISPYEKCKIQLYITFFLSEDSSTKRIERFIEVNSDAS